MFLIPKSYWQVKKTKNKGRGVFAKKTIVSGTIIGDYVGKIVQLEEIDFDKEKENMFLMFYSDSSGIYPDLEKPGVHLINHSCSPNCWLYQYEDHTLVFALEDIKNGQELTISYLLPPKKFCKPCVHKCYCGSKNCTGSMHLTEVRYQKWNEFQNKEFKQSLAGQASRNTRIEGIRNAKRVELLAKYPVLVPEIYVKKINYLGFKAEVF